MQKEAAVDNDFVTHLSEIDNWEQKKLMETVKLLFDELNISPVMHELVYTNELNVLSDSSNIKKALLFFENGIIKQKKIYDFLDTESKRKYYEMVFKEVYRDFKGNLPDSIKDIFKDWKKRASLGETHTVVMCFMINCDIFLSDDSGSETLAKILRSKKAFDVKVYNREKACERLKEIGSTAINKTDRRVLKHKAK